jgi:hypothetical protein
MVDRPEPSTLKESQLGFPARRSCRSLVGELTTDALIIERQWESFAVLEATYEKALMNPEHRALSEEADQFSIRVSESDYVES